MSRGTPKGVRSGHREGFTLVELVMVLMLIGIIVGTAVPNYTDYRNRVVPQQASAVIGNFVALARSYAIQSRLPSTLVIDPVNRQAVIRVDGEDIRALDLGPNGDYVLDTLDMDMPGDSITFTARGICSQCGMAGTGAIIVAARGTSYLITFNAVGSWKREVR
jgi:prepilin-type N-terminal cleavage/methylation domain-containing protein